MKIIQTKSFLKKQAQFNSLPGDTGLPPGVSNQMIDKQFGAGEPTDYRNQTGEYETKVDWGQLTQDLLNASSTDGQGNIVAYDVGGLPQRGIGNIVVYYTYDAEEFGGDITISNIRLLDIKTLMGGQYQPLTVSEPATKEGIFDGFQDEIVEQEKRIIKEVSQGQPWEPDRTEELY